MYIVIVGCGKVGYHLGKLLLSEAHEVLIIEKDKARVAKASAELGEAILEGNGSRVSTLREGGVNRADVLVAATGIDEENLVICQVAKSVFRCRRTIARVNDPGNETLFSELGIDATVSATRLIDAIIEEQVNATDMVIPLVTLRSGNAEIVEITLSSTSKMIGKEVGEIIPPKGVLFVAVIRGDALIPPETHTKLVVADKVIVLTRKEAEQTLHEMI